MQTLEETVLERVKIALEKAKGNKSVAAVDLNVSVKTVYNYVWRYDELSKFRPEKQKCG